MNQYFGIWSDIGFVLFGLSALVLAGGSIWIRAKRLSHEVSTRIDETESRRLDRLEQTVDGSVRELQRVAENQRHLSHLLAERDRGVSPP